MEVGHAYGGKIDTPGMKLLRFANRIPLLYDEANDVAFKIINDEIDWRRYKIPQDAPMAIITHVCSTKVPYKTVGKEYLADRPELERELKNAVREVLRKLASYVSRKGSMEFQKKRLNIYAKYLPLIAQFSTELSGKKKRPDYKKLLGSKAVLEEVGESEASSAEKTGEKMNDDETDKRSVSKGEVKQDAQQKLEEYGGSS